MSGTPDFIVIAWPTDTAKREVEITRCKKLLPAIRTAITAARDGHYRTVAIQDDDRMEWARYNMLWAIPVEAIGIGGNDE